MMVACPREAKVDAGRGDRMSQRDKIFCAEVMIVSLCLFHSSAMKYEECIFVVENGAWFAWLRVESLATSG